jgi:hypothetical protein
MARRSQLLVRNGRRIGSNQHRVKVLADVPLDQQRASTRSLLHFRFAINNGHTQEQSEYPKVPVSDMALSAADTLGEGVSGYTQ